MILIKSSDSPGCAGRPEQPVHGSEETDRSEKEHQALQNTAPMEFVYVKESAYPLVYKRTGKEETVYIVLNPSGQDVECEAEIPENAQVIYSNHDEAFYAEGVWKVPAASATYLAVSNK